MIIPALQAEGWIVGSVAVAVVAMPSGVLSVGQEGGDISDSGSPEIQHKIKLFKVYETKQSGCLQNKT